MADKGPVKVTLSVEWPRSGRDHETEDIEIDREEWDSMSPADRVAMIRGELDDLVANYVAAGWHIADKDDMAEADES